MHHTDRTPGIASPALGYLCVAVAAALWAASGTVSKHLFQSGVSPHQLVQLRTTIGAVVLLCWLLMRSRAVLKIDRKDLPYFFMLGLGLAAAQFTYLYAISRIAVAAAILLQYQAPVLIALHAALFSRTRLMPSTIAALIGAVAGCYLMVGAYNLDMLAMNRLGVLSGLASAAAFAWYTVRSERGMRTYHPWGVLAYALLFAALVWNVLHRPLDSFLHTYAAGAWWWIAFVGVFGTILPFGLYNKGISMISATRASITATLEPVIAGVIAYLFLGETMEVLQIVGAVSVIASILTLQIRQATR